MAKCRDLRQSDRCGGTADSGCHRSNAVVGYREWRSPATRPSGSNGFHGPLPIDRIGLARTGSRCPRRWPTDTNRRRREPGVAGIHHFLSRRDVCRWRVPDEPERRGRTGRYRFHVDAQLTGQRGRNNRGTSAGARSPVVELCAAESQTPATNVVIAKAAVKPDGRFRFQSTTGVLRASDGRVPGPGAYARFSAHHSNHLPEGFGMTSGSSDVPLPLAPPPAAPTLWGTLPVMVP